MTIHIILYFILFLTIVRGSTTEGATSLYTIYPLTEYSNVTTGCNTVSCPVNPNCTSGIIYFCAGDSLNALITFNTSLHINKSSKFFYVSYPNSVLSTSTLYIYIDNIMKENIIMSGCPYPQRYVNFTIKFNITKVLFKVVSGFNIIGNRDCNRATSETFIIAYDNVISSIPISTSMKEMSTSSSIPILTSMKEMSTSSSNSISKSKTTSMKTFILTKSTTLSRQEDRTVSVISNTRSTEFINNFTNTNIAFVTSTINPKNSMNFVKNNQNNKQLKSYVIAIIVISVVVGIIISIVTLIILCKIKKGNIYN